MGDINESFAQGKSKWVKVDYTKRNSFEFRLNYKRRVTQKTTVFIGTSYLNSRFELNTILLPRVDWWSSSYGLIPFKYQAFGAENRLLRNLSINYTGLNLGGSIAINENITIGAGLNAYIPFYHQFNTEVEYSGKGSGSENKLVDEDSDETVVIHYSYDISVRTGEVKSFLIPEINTDIRIFENCFITLGFRWKFWQGKYDKLIMADVQGYVDSSISTDIEQIHLSEARQQGMYYTFGIKYTLPVFKK